MKAEAGPSRAAMEALSQQLERFSEVLAASRTPHVRSWGPATVRRALQWARYMRHVHRRFGRHAGIRPALERRLRDQWRREDGAAPAAYSGLTSFRSLGRCDLLLALRLLGNRALGDAAFRCLLGQLCPGPGAAGDPEEEEETLQDRLALLARRWAAVHLLRACGLGGSPAARGDPLAQTQAELLLQRLREVGQAAAEGPRTLLSGLWERLPQDSFLGVIAAALLLPSSSSPGSPPKELELDSPKTPGEGRHELVQWLLGKSDAMAAFCHSLPAGLLASVVGRHPELFPAYLALLRDWGRQLHYDLQEGVWVGAEARDGPWEELLSRFQSLCQAPSPLKDEVLRALETCKAQDGGFEVPGLSIWTDLLLALGNGV